MSLGQTERWRSTGSIARQGRRRGRIRYPRHPYVRDRRRAPGRAEHPHGSDPQRTGRRAHGQRLRSGVRETRGWRWWCPAQASTAPRSAWLLRTRAPRRCSSLPARSRAARSASTSGASMRSRISPTWCARDQVAASGAQAPGGSGRCVRSLQADAHRPSPSRPNRDAARGRCGAGRSPVA